MTVVCGNNDDQNTSPGMTRSVLGSKTVDAVICDDIRFS